MTDQIPLEVLKAARAMNEEKFLNAMLKGDNKQAQESLKRMAYALSQIEQYQPYCGDCCVPLDQCNHRP